MATFFDDDIVNVRIAGQDDPYQMYWGDPCQVGQKGPKTTQVKVRGPDGKQTAGTVSSATTFRNDGILRLSMVDVQQGDGLILETPSGKVVFIDGGDNQLFARHAAARFPGTSEEKPLDVDAMVVTHGDADHFAGLSEIRKSETHAEPRKRLFVAPRRVLHNGLVKAPSSSDDLLGPTTKVQDRTYCTELFENLLKVPDTRMNVPFKTWKATLTAWNARTKEETGKAIEFTRIDQNVQDAFDFLAEDDITVQVLGPIAAKVNGKPALEFLREPPKSANLELGIGAGKNRGALSESHTISFLRDVGPVVSIISSGDESTAKEYIHPRATLMAALGRASRSTPAIIFCTELAAFFATRGYVEDPKTKRKFFAFERTNFGIIHIRTDGKRVLAFTHSGKARQNEAYSFTVSPTGDVAFADEVTNRAAPKA